MEEAEDAPMLTSGGGGDMSASVEETNRIRKELGLPPLAVPDAEEVEAAKKKEEEERRLAAEAAEKAAKDAEQLEHLAKLKKKRLLTTKYIEGKSLGEELTGDQATSAAEWAERARKRREKKLAEQRARSLKEQDEEFSRVAVNAESYGRADLKGLAVQHDAEEVEQGKSYVLTLKDAPILKDGKTPNKAADVLENIDLVEERKLRENKLSKSKTVGYNPYADRGGELLAQYKETIEGKKEAPKFRLDQSGGFAADLEAHKKAVRERLAASNEGKVKYDLSSLKTVGTDFYTPEELVSFKKRKGKKKKRKKRKRPRLREVALPEPSAQDRMEDHRSKHAVSVKEDKKKQERLEKNQAYLNALKKSEAKSHWVEKEACELEEAAAALELEQLEVEQDMFLQNSLTNARNVALRKKHQQGVEAVAEAVRQIGRTKAKAGPKDDRVVLTSTTEFCALVARSKDVKVKSEPARHGASVPAAAVRATEEEDVKMETEEEVKAEEVKVKKERNGEAEGMEMDEGDEEEEVMEAEPVLSKGLGAALQLAKKRGMLQNREALSGRGKKETKEGGGEVRIEYFDQFGRKLTPNEAYRQMSWKFHGRAPGKKKMEQRMMQYQQERRAQSETHRVRSLSQLQRAQKRKAQPFVVLDEKKDEQNEEEGEAQVLQLEKRVKKRRKKAGPGKEHTYSGGKKVEFSLKGKTRPDTT